MSEQKKISEIAARNEADTGQVGAPTHDATAPKCSETRAVSGQTEKAKPPEPGQNPGPKSTEDQASKRAADVLIGLVDTAALFHSEDQTACADLRIYGARVTCAVMSKKFESFLTQRYFETTGKAPRSDALKEAQSTLSAHSQFCSPCRKVHRRIARLDGKVYLIWGTKLGMPLKSTRAAGASLLLHRFASSGRQRPKPCRFQCEEGVSVYCVSC